MGAWIEESLIVDAPMIHTCFQVFDVGPLPIDPDEPASNDGSPTYSSASLRCA